MSETYTPDNLIVGLQRDIVNRPVNIKIGEDLCRGALLGRVLRALGDAEADAGNTGEGTIDGALGALAKLGTYTITCTAVAGPGSFAQFSVINPEGHRLDDAEADTLYEGEIDFILEEYGTAFAVGDLFTVAVDEGSLQGLQATLDAVDGSAEPFGVLAEDADASLATVLTTAYISGEFGEEAVGYDGAEDVDDWRETCAAVGIYLRPTVSV